MQTGHTGISTNLSVLSVTASICLKRSNEAVSLTTEITGQMLIKIAGLNALEIVICDL